MKYEECLEKIKASDKVILKQSEEAWKKVAKPLKSLGVFEEMVSRLAAAEGNVYPSIANPKVLVFCADNGVVEEGISQSTHEVTTAVAKAIALGESNINILARRAGATVSSYDVGMIDDIDEIATFKLCHGTKNIAKAPAMSKEEAIFAIEVGINAAKIAKDEGACVLGIGEMGIGNTTTSAAIISFLTDTKAKKITGRGSGLSDDGLKKKIKVIKKAIKLNAPNREDGIDVLAKLGGFDIAAMAGVCLAGAALKTPVILDGVISQAAALVACTIKPEVADYLVASHVSKEKAGKVVLDKLGLTAPIKAGLALGEGTGAALLIPLLNGVIDIYSGTHSFDSIGVKQYEKLSE